MLRAPRPAPFIKLELNSVGKWEIQAIRAAERISKGLPVAHVEGYRSKRRIAPAAAGPRKIAHAIVEPAVPASNGELAVAENVPSETDARVPALGGVCRD